MSQPIHQHDAPPLYILVGGASTRFGSDKALAEHQGRPLAVGVAEALGASAGSVTLVADRPGRYAQMGLRVIDDRHPGHGPIAGLEASLHDRLSSHGEGWLALASCDLVDPKPEWLSRLSEAADQGIQAVAYRGERWEPMLALYHSSLIVEVSQRIESVARSMQRLLDAVESVALPLPDGLNSLPQANTPAELAYHTRAPTEPDDA